MFFCLNLISMFVAEGPVTVNNGSGYDDLTLNRQPGPHFTYVFLILIQIPLRYYVVLIQNLIKWALKFAHNWLLWCKFVAVYRLGIEWDQK